MDAEISRQTGSKWLPLLLWALLLLLIIPMAMGLAVYCYRVWQERVAIQSHNLIYKKTITLHAARGLNNVPVTFTKSNVTDEDLESFIPSFNGHLSKSYPNITVFRLNGSKVSPEAIERFRRAVPQCKVEP